MSKPQVRKIISAKTGVEWWAAMVDGRTCIYCRWEAALYGIQHPHIAVPFDGDFTLVSEVSK